MHIIRKSDASTQDLPTEMRRYYVPSRDPFEIIETLLEQGATQSPHAHETVREAILVLEGTVFTAEIVSGKTIGTDLHPGDFAVFDPRTLHFMENRTTNSARTLHFKFLGDKKDRSLFITDKTCVDKLTNMLQMLVTDDAKFKSYVDTYNNLDKLLWQIPALLVTVSSLGFSLFSSFISDPEVELLPFDHGQSIAIFIWFWALMYFLGAYSMYRIRKHHNIMGRLIAAFDPTGYFEQRRHIVASQWSVSAPRLISIVFAGLCIGLLALGFFNW